MDNQSQIVSLRNAEVIDSEAADWLAKLDGGTLSPEDRRALKQWLADDPRHVSALKGLASIWGDMDILLNHVPDTGAVKTVSVLSLFNSQRWALPVLASCCIVLLAWVLTPTSPPKATEKAFYTTGVGKQKVEHFSDGSSAHLNTDSIIDTEFSDTARIVRLLRGEAMFDVAHDPLRPFTVYVGNRKVIAIGTTFVVRLSSENILVTVTDGQVQLSKRGADENPADNGDAGLQQQEVIVISKGEVAEVSDTGAQPTLAAVEGEELNRRLSWVKGKLIFKDERLEQVIQEISRYVSVRIIVDDPILREVRISGRFEIGDTEALLEAIEVSLNLNADHIDDKIIRLSRSVEIP